jgi:competence protein ComEC
LLPLLALAQMLGILLADRGLLLPTPARVLAGVALVGAAVCARRPRAVAAAACALASAAGALALGQRLADAQRSVPAAPVERSIEATLHAVMAGSAGYRLDLVDVVGVETEALPAPPRRVVLYGQPTPAELPALERQLPGARIRARVRLRAPAELRNPGMRSQLRDLARAGIGAEGRLTHPALHARLPEREGRRPLAGLHARRLAWGERMAAAGAGGALLRALALGDRASLTPQQREDFARLGIAHLLAVSGLHLALVAASAFAVVRFSVGRSAWLAARRDTRSLAVAAAVAAACGYAVLSGWGVPVRRALVLLLGLALAVTGARPRAALPPMAAAAIVVLADEPGALFRPGAQLSFAASLALVAAARRAAPAPSSDASRLRRQAAMALRASASAVAVTAPLAAFHLGSSAPFALLVNLVAVPWTACVLLPAAGLAAIACALPPGEPADSLLAGAAAAAESSLIAAGELAVRLPAAGVFGGLARWAWALLAVLVAASFAAARTRTRVLLASAVTAIVAAAPPPERLPATPRLVVLEVGQGDAALVQSRDAAVLIDAGGALPGARDMGRRVVLPALAALGIRALDLVVVTHADLDHRGGVPAVLEALPVGRVWLPYGAANEAGFERLRDVARRRRVPVLERGAGAPAADFGALRVTPLWPPRGSEGAPRNDRSLVVRVEVAGRRILLPGDIEAGAEASLVAAGADLASDVLALAHHGSRTSSSTAFLEAVDADVAIVSAPCGGRFAMPHGEVVARTRERETSLWWTGRDGAVLVGLGAPLTVFGTPAPAVFLPHACRVDVGPGALGRAPEAFGYDGEAAPTSAIGRDDAR